MNLSQVRSTLAVGTPDYLSPEILRAVEGGGGYGLECDWWALGICAYEMLLGATPFYAESIAETYAKIIRFQVHKRSFCPLVHAGRCGICGACQALKQFTSSQDHFEFPSSGPEISEPARSLIAGLISEREDRLGRKGFGDFRGHPFFGGLDWASLHELPAPFLPEVSNPTDTSNFDIMDDCLGDMVFQSQLSRTVEVPRRNNGCFCRRLYLT